jgi:hypothetical protein
MSTKKKQFNFYADDDVAEYLDSLESGLKAKRINELIRAGIGKDGERVTAQYLEDKLEMLERACQKFDDYFAAQDKCGFCGKWFLSSEPQLHCGCMDQHG